MTMRFSAAIPVTEASDEMLRDEIGSEWKTAESKAENVSAL